MKDKEVKLKIDSRSVTVPDGTTILDAASRLDIDIPTLCHQEGLEPFTSCFMCVVDVEGRPNPAPSCSTMAAEGMKVQTQSQNIRNTRKMCLELLLSDHCGDCVAPCVLTCPAGCNIQEFIKAIAEGRENDAIQTIKETLPIPGALGRICPRPCESQCRRVRVEESLAIGWLHRYAADTDEGKGRIYCPDPGSDTGKRVAVVGAGPAGMSAAYFLRQKGHAVTVFEAEKEPGGMLRWGIPSYRLPRDQLGNELKAIIEMGVEMRYGRALGKDFSLDDLRKQGFNAIFIAVGTPLSSSLRAEGEHLQGVIGGIEFLGRVAHGETLQVGQKVMVVGGGNTAVDAVRTARRLGADEVTLLYRRTRVEMPALAIEVDEAELEGVQFHFLAAPIRIQQQGGHLNVHCQQMKLGEPDESGRRRPVPIEGDVFDLEADTVIVAIGQTLDAGVLRNAGIELDQREKAIVVNPDTLQTAMPDVFAGGDAVAREDQKIAVWAVGSGKLASICIDQFLNGQPVTGQPTEFRVSMGEGPDEVTDLRFAGVEKVARVVMREKKPKDRVKNFQEVELGFTQEMARTEAGRCLACGCAAADDCKLREYALEYEVDINRFVGAMRDYTIDASHPDIILEQGKCIDCGICVRMSSDDEEQGVFGFVERGFDIRIRPFFELLSPEPDHDFCLKCAESCPTGAIVKRTDLGTHVCFARPGKGGENNKKEITRAKPDRKRT